MLPLFVIRPPGRAPYTVTLDRLTALVRAARELRMPITRDELKKKRLQAMGVVGVQMDASAAMFDRLIAAGDKVTVARTAAEAAQMGAIDAQVADLNEMAEEFADMGNGTATTGTAPAIDTAAPIKVTLTPSDASAALASLNAAQPPALGKDAWAKGDAYLGTHPDLTKPQPPSFTHADTMAGQSTGTVVKS